MRDAARVLLIGRQDIRNLLATEPEMKSKALFGIVHSEREADDLISALLGEGFRGRDISLLLPPGGGLAEPVDATEVRLPTGAIVGAGMGVVLGGLLGLVASSGAILGITVETASSVAVLASAAVFGPLGSAVGGILGHLSERADREEPASKPAHIVVSVSSDDSTELEVARVVFTSRGAAEVCVAGDDRPTAHAGVRAQKPERGRLLAAGAESVSVGPSGRPAPGSAPRGARAP